MNDGKRILRKRWLIAAVAIWIAWNMQATLRQGRSPEYSITAATPIGAQIQCFRARNLVVTRSVGPCPGYSPPNGLEVGAKFSADGTIRRIGVVYSVPVSKDMPRLALKAGDHYCVAAERADDIHNAAEGDGDGIWLFAAKCDGGIR